MLVHVVMATYKAERCVFNVVVVVVVMIIMEVM